MIDQLMLWEVETPDPPETGTEEPDIPPAPGPDTEGDEDE